MAISEAYSNSATIGTSEYSLPNNSTTPASITDDGVYQVFISFSAMAAGDEYLVKVKEKVTSGGSQETVYQATLSYAQPGPFVSPSLILMHGWDVTVDKISGTDRSIAWSIRKVA
jgi:hypothetical protein